MVEETQAQVLFDELIGVLTDEAIAALRRRDYEASQELTRIVRSLEETSLKTTVLLDNPALADRNASGKEGLGTNDRNQSQVEESDGAARDEYPRIFRRKDFLVKQALRSDGKTTYEQKMPRENFIQILTVLRRALLRQREFHATELQNEVEVPNYHLYMTLNLLQDTGHLDVPQRGLYRFQKTDQDPWAARVWEETPAEH